MITREVYVVDVSAPDPAVTGFRFIDERRAHLQIDDLMRAAPRGSSVRLIIGKVPPPFSADEFMRPAAHWLDLLRVHAVQIEGEVRTVRAWMAVLEGVAA